MSSDMPNVTTNKVGFRIRDLRERRQWSQGDLSERTGIQVPALSRYENGRVIPDLATLLRIAGAFGVGVEALV